MDAYLESIYTDPAHPASYTSAEKLYKWIKKYGRRSIALSKIKDWLKGVEAHTLHVGVRRHFQRNRVVVSQMDELWHSDLMDMSNVSNVNDGISYVLVCIDVFSRYLWVSPLKSKRGVDTSQAFQKIFSLGRKPLRVKTDKGTEFTNKVVQHMFKERGIIHNVTQNEVKANYSERVIKTLKSRIHKYFTHNQTYKYIRKLNDFVDSYNNTYHRTIRMAPTDVNAGNESQVWFEQYAEPLLNRERTVTRKPVYKVGDIVRLSHLRSSFEREYSERWTGELFKVTRVNTGNSIITYMVKDYMDEEIKGLFYRHELQSVKIDPEQPYKVEKILKTRTRKGVKEHLVRWLHWGSKFDSWVNDRDLFNLHAHG